MSIAGHNDSNEEGIGQLIDTFNDGRFIFTHLYRKDTKKTLSYPGAFLPGEKTFERNKMRFVSKPVNEIAGSE
jgi:hypothetical protein